MSSSFRFLEHPPMPAALHFSIKSVLVFFPSVSRSCSGADVVMALPVPAVAASCTHAREDGRSIRLCRRRRQPVPQPGAAAHTTIEKWL